MGGNQPAKERNQIPNKQLLDMMYTMTMFSLLETVELDMNPFMQIVFH